MLGPEWAAINFGVTLCQQCAGLVHMLVEMILTDTWHVADTDAALHDNNDASEKRTTQYGRQ